MADNTRRNWYIGFGAVLTAIGTFLVTTDPIFHYGELLSSKPKIDSTRVVTNIPKVTIDSLISNTADELPPTLYQVNRKLKKLETKDVEHDSIIHKVILGDQ